ncbi:RcpC/CpaB family pilus assembly protein [Streptomyces sp. NPDC006134]|uniref:RcpC/CpaB family pilus assembly protein n=1 Tax=Streptomyces sp. NPDC006134 TaxID=3154467 RepID=UPI0033C4BE9A
MPQFDPVRVRGGRYPLHRLVRHRRRTVAVGLAVTAAVLVAVGPRDTDRARGHPQGQASRPAHAQPATAPARERPVRPRHAAGTVAAPVRIADAATVRLLRPGDRVDVIAAEDTATGGEARVVARGARVTKVPEAPEAPERAADPEGNGALVVLSVPRATAARLAGAGVTARLAVTLW